MLDAVKRRFPALVRVSRALRWRRHILSDWLAASVFTRTREVETPLGFKLRAGSARANRMMQEGTFEPEETAVLQDHLARTDVFVDVGANVGLYTCLARRMGRHVVAFEPQEANLACLYSNLQSNGWSDVEVFPLGLGAQPGLMTLYGASGPSASLVRGWAGYPSGRAQTIATSTLDIVVGTRFEGKRLLVKVDVEGAEYGVLRGAERVLRRRPRPTWMMEVCLTEFHPGGINPHFLETFERFWELGYEARLANRARRVVTPDDVRRWAAARRTDDGVFNYVFEPKEASPAP
jgi:FkbM family methyltransferase